MWPFSVGGWGEGLFINIFFYICITAQSAGAVEYTDSISAEG